MVSSIGGASAAQEVYATRVNTRQPAAAAQPPARPASTDDTPVATQSEESAAAARLGDQLNADADAARVQRAVDASATTVQSDTSVTGEAGATTTASAGAQGPQAPAGGAGGAGATSSSSTDNDYIAEADTNSDKTVSDEEQAVYDAKLRQQAAEQAGQQPVDAQTPADQSAAVRTAYGRDDPTAPALDITA